MEDNKKTEEIKETKTFTQDDLNKIVQERIAKENKKNDDNIKDLQNQIELLKKEKQLAVNETEKTAEQKMQELETQQKEIIQKMEEERKIAKENNKRLVFKNKMLSQNVSEEVAEVISQSTSINAIDEFDFNILPKKVINTNINVEDKKEEVKEKSWSEKAKDFL